MGDKRSVLFMALLVACSPRLGMADAIVAVASNFTTTAEALAKDFGAGGGRSLRLVAGSSGKLYAQIVNGAPFDLFLSADIERPARLEREGRAVADSRRTYALGRLVAWSRDPEIAATGCLASLAALGPRKLAIANPALAPYGAAARQYLEFAGLWQRVRPSLVVGENINQAFQFVAQGGAAVGLVAVSQLGVAGVPEFACAERLPEDAYTPVEQQFVLLPGATDTASEFAAYLESERAREIIRDAGYALPARPR